MLQIILGAVVILFTDIVLPLEA